MPTHQSEGAGLSRLPKAVILDGWMQAKATALTYLFKFEGVHESRAIHCSFREPPGRKSR